jgi:hypothetical protein
VCLCVFPLLYKALKNLLVLKESSAWFKSEGLV